MSEIVILDKMPVILTKKGFQSKRVVATDGAIIVLPQDAVLVVLPEITEKREI